MLPPDIPLILRFFDIFLTCALDIELSKFYPMDKLKDKLTPTQLLVLGYMAVTLLGALLLSLPISSVNGTRQSFVDALFLSVSGISTSGLSVVDISSYYTKFGQLILMAIFQIGGIGYMTFVVFVSYLLGIKLSRKTSVIAKQSLATQSYHMLGQFFVKVLVYTFTFEFVGGIILSIFWMKEFSFFQSLYLGFFHSISAFCTAGFSLFPNSLMNYQNNLLVNLTINIVSIIGGLGFFVLVDLYNYLYKKYKKIIPGKLTLHTRLTLIVTLAVMLTGSIVILLSEKWSAGMSLYDKIMQATFQSISASTTDGYNSVDIGMMSSTSLTILMILMFIGASPGSTGGGMKTTTLGTLIISVKSYLQGKSSVNLFRKELPENILIEAFTVFFLFASIALIDVIILAKTENYSYIKVLFEIISALGNTGLSTGITTDLTFTGKMVLILTMFIGRVGPLTIGAALVVREHKVLYKYPQEELFIG